MNLGRVIRVIFTSVKGETWHGRAERSQQIHNLADRLLRENTKVKYVEDMAMVESERYEQTTDH